MTAFGANRDAPADHPLLLSRATIVMITMAMGSEPACSVGMNAGRAAADRASPARFKEALLVVLKAAIISQLPTSLDRNNTIPCVRQIDNLYRVISEIAGEKRVCGLLRDKSRIE